MPAIKKGESRKDYVNRCIPHVMKKEGLDRNAAAGKCNGMYKQHKKKGTQYTVEELKGKEAREADARRLGISLEEYDKSISEQSFMFECENVDFFFNADGKFDFANNKGYNLVIMKANSFMRGIYMSRDMVKKIYKGWNNTPHDINHMGTGYQMGFSVIPSNIEYVVGYQDKLQYDNPSGEVRATVHVDDKSPKYDAWESYVRICESMGRTPNVSMFVKGKLNYLEARNLPKDSHYHSAGYKADDLVPCMDITETVAVSTVFTGACNDKDGCGIKNNYQNSDNSESIKTWEVELKKEENEEIEIGSLDDLIKYKMRRDYLKKRLNNLRGK
jgi:ribosomal protein L13E